MVLKLVLLNVYLDQLTIWIGIVCLIMMECSMMIYGVTVYLWLDIFHLEQYKPNIYIIA